MWGRSNLSLRRLSAPPNPGHALYLCRIICIVLINPFAPTHGTNPDATLHKGHACKVSTTISRGHSDDAIATTFSTIGLTILKETLS